MKAINYIRNNLHILLKSFDFNKFMYITVIQIGAFLAFFLSARWLGNMFARITGSVDLTSLQNLDPSAGIDPVLQSAVAKIWYYSLIFVVVMFLIWCASQLSSWIIIADRKFFRRHKTVVVKRYLKFLLFNLLWLLIWTIPIAFSMNLIYQSSTNPALLPQTRFWIYLFAFIVMDFVIYFTFIAYHVFARTGKVRHSVKESFALGFGKIHHFILPAIIAYILMIFAGIITMPFSGLPPNISNWIFFVVFTLYISWMMLYFSKILLKLEQRFPKYAYKENKR
ncbi:MAG: hypothetical protein ACLFUO_03630 [Candidatus Woesearchaeota archaeon]